MTGPHPTVPLRVRVLIELRAGAASSVDLAALLDVSVKHVCVALSRLVADCKVRRLWQQDVAGNHGGKKPWVYGLLGKQYRMPAKPKTPSVGSGVWAGSCYRRGYAGWGRWL